MQDHTTITKITTTTTTLTTTTLTTTTMTTNRPSVPIKITLDRSQLDSILATIRERNKLTDKKRSKSLPLFKPKIRERPPNLGPLGTVTKLSERVYFADRIKYGGEERVGRISFQSNQGRPFQLPRIEGQETYKYEKTIWRHISKDITRPLQTPTSRDPNLPEKILPPPTLIPPLPNHKPPHPSCTLHKKVTLQKQSSPSLPPRKTSIASVPFKQQASDHKKSPASSQKAAALGKSTRLSPAQQRTSQHYCPCLSHEEKSTPSFQQHPSSGLALHKKSTPPIQHLSSTLPFQLVSPLPPHKKHTLSTFQQAGILQDLNLFNNPQEEREATRVPKHILNVDPDFFSIVQGRKIRSTSESDYVTTVRRVLLTKLRIGVIKDEISKVHSQFIKDQKSVEAERNKLSQEYAKYERFVRDDYKQVMQMENRSRLSSQRLSLAQQEYEAAHSDYYDVRIGLFRLDEVWTQAKLCKNFARLMTGLNQVKDDEEKLVLINKVNALNQMKVSKSLEDIVDNFKQDLETIKQEIEEKKRLDIDRKKSDKKLLKRKTTEYDIYEDDFDFPEVVDDTKDAEKEEISDLKSIVTLEEHETATEIEEETLHVKGETNVETEDDKAVKIAEKLQLEHVDTTKLEETTQPKESIINGDTDETKHDDTRQDDDTQHFDQTILDDSEDEEFIKLIIMDDVTLEKDNTIEKKAKVSKRDVKLQEKLGFNIEDLEDDYDLDSLDKMSDTLERLNEDNMNVLLQKENVQDKLEQCSRMHEISDAYFSGKTQQLTRTVETLQQKVNDLMREIGALRGDIKTNYEGYVKEVCSNENNVVLEVLIADLFEHCISKHLHNASALHLFTQFQDSLQELRSGLAILPIPIVTEATGQVARNLEASGRNATAAQRKLAELDHYVTRLNRNLAPPHKKTAKPLRPRSQPPTTPPPQLQLARSLAPEERDYLLFFTDFDQRAPDADQLAQTYLSQRPV